MVWRQSRREKGVEVGREAFAVDRDVFEIAIAEQSVDRHQLSTAGAQIHQSALERDGDLGVGAISCAEEREHAEAFAGQLVAGPRRVNSDRQVGVRCHHTEQQCSVGDGAGDVVAGLPMLGARGAAILYSGATGAQLTRRDGMTEARFGSSVTGVGDFDGDGFADWAAGVSDGGFSFVVVSGADASPLMDALLLGGARVSRAGDLNGDGRDDLLVGGENFGTTNLFAMSAIGPIPLWRRYGAIDAPLGGSAVGIGDLDGDGLSDIAAYVEHLGSRAATIDVLSGLDGTRLTQLTLSASGSGSVDRAGDLDRDGRPDILVGAWFTGGVAQAWSPTPAAQRPYERIFGNSCFGSWSRHPLIGHGGQPTPLGAFTVKLEHAASFSNATLLIGTRTGVALDPLGLYGCVLFVNPFATIATSTDSFGRAEFAQGVSLSAAMQGLEIDYQWVSVTPPQGGLPLQLSAGMRVGFSM